VSENNSVNLDAPYRNENDQYPEFMQSVKTRFNSIIGQGIPLFTVNVSNLFDDVLLENLPPEARQHYKCNSCRQFFNRYGILITNNAEGDAVSVMWDEANTPAFFVPAVLALKKAVLKAEITGVFLTSNPIMGTPQTGEWEHLSTTLPTTMLKGTRSKTAEQLMAGKLEDRKMLIRALTSFQPDVIAKVVALINTGTLDREDTVSGMAEWFQALHTKFFNEPNSQKKESLLWFAVATAPEAFMHIKNTVLGKLLKDLTNGDSFETVVRKFSSNVSSDTYQRAQSAPSQGAIDQAEKMFAESGFAPSLRRKFATFGEIPEPAFLWKDKAIARQVIQKAASVGTLFGGVEAKVKSVEPSNSGNLPDSTVSWDKFERTILPTADIIEILVDDANRMMALVTAADESAPNMLQWGNPFSWYYHGGIDGMKQRVENAGGRYENNEIRCSLSWDGGTDLDLSCRTPSGENLHFGTTRRTSRCGGNLDVDANGGSVTSMTPVENIRWIDGAQSGMYTFTNTNYAQRGRGPVPFKMELEVGGRIYSYSGVAEQYDGKGGKWKQDVFSFRYVKGQPVNVIMPNLASATSVVAETWGVPLNSFVKVKGITNSPNLWEEQKVTHTGEHIFFLLEGCKDESSGKGRGFLIETLQSELKEHRKTLESFVAKATIEGVEEASACGVGQSKDSNWNITVRVTSNNLTRLVKIDRFD
jgi:hypothetical protein